MFMSSEEKLDAHLINELWKIRPLAKSKLSPDVTGSDLELIFCFPCNSMLAFSIFFRHIEPRRGTLK
jgi:hypothetical protein